MASKTAGPEKLDLPLSAKEQRFVRFYCRPDVRDLEKAGGLAGMKTKAESTRAYNKPAVRAEIDRRLRLLELEQARLDAETEVLTDSLIDKALAETMGVCAKEHGSTKLAAITLALVAKGRIETRNAKSVMAVTSPSGFRPQIYGSIAPQPGTTTLRETKEIIQTAHAALPQAPAHVFEVIER